MYVVPSSVGWRYVVRYWATSQSGKFGGGWRSLETIGRSISNVVTVTRLARAGNTNSPGGDGGRGIGAASTDAVALGADEALGTCEAV